VKKSVRNVDFLLVGGSFAAAAETLRLGRADGSIVIVGPQDQIPYHRQSRWHAWMHNRRSLAHFRHCLSIAWNA